MNDLEAYRSTHMVGMQVSENLSSVLRVAGPVRDAGLHSPLRATEVNRRSGIARSTLRAITNPKEGSAPNPDLHTLVRLAEVLNLPAAFLLMSQNDWLSIIQAINGIRDPHAAAEKLVNNDGTAPPKLLEKVLSECGLHPDRPPAGGYENRTELARMNARNEWRVRMCNIYTALFDKGGSDRTSKVLLTALIASYINITTPHDPANQKD